MQNMVVLNAQRLGNILIPHIQSIFQEVAVKLEQTKDFKIKYMEATINMIRH